MKLKKTNKRVASFPAGSEEKVAKFSNIQPHPVDQQVGSKLRHARSLMGITQEQLGSAVGLTFQQIQKYEKGVNRISCSRLWEFSQLLNITPYNLFEDVNPQKDVADIHSEILEAAEDQESFQEEAAITKRETLELVRIWYNIKDLDTRKKMLSLLRSISGDDV